MDAPRRASGGRVRAVASCSLATVGLLVCAASVHAQGPPDVVTGILGQVLDDAVRGPSPDGALPWWVPPLLGGFAFLLGAAALVSDGFGFSWPAGPRETAEQRPAGHGAEPPLDDASEADLKSSGRTPARSVGARTPTGPKPVPIGLAPEVLEILNQRRRAEEEAAGEPPRVVGEIMPDPDDDPPDESDGIDILIPR